MVFISIFKEKGYNVNDFDNLINSTDDKNIKEQLKVIKSVYIYYENKIIIYGEPNYRKKLY